MPTYDSLLNDKVRFLQGSQADLNKLFVGGENAGKAVEGAFYLTTDSHRLYVGRKDTSISGDNVFPVQVSPGVSVVADAGSLPSTAAAEAASGDLYYIEDSNILAALKVNNDGTKEWVQVNPKTGINGLTINATDSSVSGSTNQASITFGLQAEGSDYITAAQPVVLKAGQNIELTTENNTVTIKSLSGQLNLNAKTNDTTNKAEVVLSDPDHHFNDTATAFVAGNADTTVTADETNNEIVISGPVVSGVKPDAYGIAGDSSSAHGFKFGLRVNGEDRDLNTAQVKNSDLDPVIAYGTNSTAYFHGGQASLDVYTRAEADTAIQNKINEKLQTADAMTYRGLIDSANKIPAITEASNGDTWKITTNIQSDTLGALRAGDLIIARGSEGSNGKITSGSWDIVPAGDEPTYEYAVTFDTAGVDPRFIITSGESTCLKVGFDNANSAKIKAYGAGTKDDFKIRLSHDTTDRTDTTNANLGAATSDSDSAGGTGLKFFALSGSLTDGKIAGLQTDAYGHVTGVQGKVVTFKHNYISKLDTSFSSSDNIGIIQVAPTHSMGAFNENPNANASLRFTSDSLKVTNKTVTVNGSSVDALAVDIVWESF